MYGGQWHLVYEHLNVQSFLELFLIIYKYQYYFTNIEIFIFI